MVWCAVYAFESNCSYAEAPEQQVRRNEIQAPGTLNFGTRVKKGDTSQSGYLSGANGVGVCCGHDLAKSTTFVHDVE